MKKFEGIYLWKVFDMLKEKKTVYILDRKKQKVYDAGAVNASGLAEIINSDNADNRYEAWTVVEAEVKDE